MNIVRHLKQKKAKKECDKKCQEYLNMAMNAELVGDTEFAKELIHKQIEAEMKYKNQYIYNSQTKVDKACQVERDKTYQSEQVRKRLNEYMETISIYTTYRENILTILRASSENMPFVPIQQLLDGFKPMFDKKWFSEGEQSLVDSLKDDIVGMANHLGYTIKTDNGMLVQNIKK